MVRNSLLGTTETIDNDSKLVTSDITVLLVDSFFTINWIHGTIDIDDYNRIIWGIQEKAKEAIAGKSNLDPNIYQTPLRTNDH